MAACTRPALAVINVPTQFNDDDGREIAKIINGEYTLIEDVDEALAVVQSNVVINGDNHTVTGPGVGNTGKGVHINGQNGVTVKNLTITGFQLGILVENSNLLGTVEPEVNILMNNIITTNIGDTNSRGIRLSNANKTNIIGNNISNSYWGIYFLSSGDTVINNWDYSNTISGNTVTGNAGGIWLASSTYNNVEGNNVTGQSAAGIYLSAHLNNPLAPSTNNTLTGNISSSNRDGINLNIANDNTITGNTCSNNQFGIKLTNSSDNTLTDNTVSGNTEYGIWIDPSNNNIFTFNDISNNEHGLYFENSSFNEVYNNNFVDNTTYHAYVTGGSGNVFNSTDPAVGGNYWSGFSGPGPYEFDIDQQDNAPWDEPDGWVVDNPPEITCPGNTEIEAMQPDGVPIDDDRIQTFLNGASATDDIDPQEDIIITHDAPALFPPGDTIVTFTAMDTSGNTSTCQATVTVVEAAESQLKIIPRIINREGRLSKILAVMRFPAGTAEEDIDIGQNLILYPGDSAVGVEASDQKIVTWYRCGTLRVSVFACFNKDEVTALIPEDGTVEMMVIGRFTSGQYFYGFDNVNIISWSWGWW
jgi:parallel beta-helix repeat protein